MVKRNGGSLVAAGLVLLVSALCPTLSTPAAATASASSIASGWSEPVRLSDVYVLDVTCAEQVCRAVDSKGRVYTYRNNSWSQPRDVYDGRYPKTLACGTPGFCLLSDLRGRVTTLTDGVWSEPTKIDKLGYLNDISCVGDTFCVAVDSAANALVYRDGVWSEPEALPFSASFIFVSCPTVSFCAAVGSGSVSFYDGRDWSDPEHIDRTDAQAVSCASPGFCMVIDQASRYVYYDGSTWSDRKKLETTRAFVQDVSCRSTACIAVDGRSRSLTWNGRQWVDRVHWAEAGGKTHVSCTAVDFCAAVNFSNASIYTG